MRPANRKAEALQRHTQLCSKLAMLLEVVKLFRLQIAMQLHDNPECTG